MSKRHVLLTVLVAFLVAFALGVWRGRRHAAPDSPFVYQPETERSPVREFWDLRQLSPAELYGLRMRLVVRLWDEVNPDESRAGPMRATAEDYYDLARVQAEIDRRGLSLRPPKYPSTTTP
jgi:hypothetical protein